MQRREDSGICGSSSRISLRFSEGQGNGIADLIVCGEQINQIANADANHGSTGHNPTGYPACACSGSRGSR